MQSLIRKLSFNSRRLSRTAITSSTNQSVFIISNRSLFIAIDASKATSNSTSYIKSATFSTNTDTNTSNSDTENLELDSKNPTEATETPLEKKKRKRREARTISKGALNIYDAIDVLQTYAWASFTESVDISVKLGVDPRKPNQMIRGSVVLPHGNGKRIRVAVFAKGIDATAAIEAGADRVGDEDLIDLCMQGDIDFQRAIATPEMMPLLSRIGKILGPKGLMPNAKVGTVTNDVTQAVKDAKGGSVHFKVQKQGILQASIGRVTFNRTEILDNIKAFMSEVADLKPENLKGKYLLSVHLSTTMGPAVLIEMPSVDPSSAKFMLDPSEL